ncbi:unnamed protein product [Rhizoctonia solani]|uniref:Uncharacterized protein n=1 Tax=Rhizoctonia solani TaxID=456999 RepID=A0A8H3HF19_9AGAM|nr:unnamed protein product [Rhizoctonia solani]
MDRNLLPCCLNGPNGAPEYPLSRAKPRPEPRRYTVSRGCGTFYAISITSAAFKGLPMVKQHKLVTEELKQEIAGFHGLQIKTKAE